MADHSGWSGPCRTINRRRALKAISTAGLAGIAGCSGGGDSGGSSDSGGTSGSDGGSSGDSGGTSSSDGGGGGSESLTFTSGPEGTLVYGVGSAMSATLRQHSDVVLNAQAGPTGQSLVQLMQGNQPLGTASAWLVQQAMNNEGRFADIEGDLQPMQIMTMMDQRTGAVTKTSTDIEYCSDVGGATVGLGPAGGSFNDPWSIALDMATDGGDFETTPTEVGQEANAVSSGRVDVQIVPMHVNGLNPSHISQMYVENDVRTLSFRDETIDAIESDTNLGLAATPNDELSDNIASFTDEPESVLLQSRYVMLGTGQISSDRVYSIMDTLWQNKGHFGEGHAGARPFSDIEFWMQTVVPELPVHPGAAEFFQEHDVWDDRYEVGEI